MAIIRSIALTGSAQQVIPPDGVEHTGPMNWTLIGSAAVTVLDAATGGNSATLPANVPVTFPAATDEEVWAAGTGTLSVIGTATDA